MGFRDTIPYQRALRASLTQDPEGPVTDYSSTITHWSRDRTANYKGSYHGEAERPSVSYIVDVSCLPTNLLILLP